MAHTIFDRIERKKILWLNYLDYASQLLAEGNVQWMNIAECVAWYRKSQSLLRSDVLHVDLELISNVFIKSDAAISTLMAEKNKPIAPLKELLAYQPLRTHISELVSAMRATFPDLVLALVCPSPGVWIKNVYLKTFPDASHPSIGEDEVDYGSLYMADFLRIFSGANVDVLLLDDDILSEELIEIYMPCYQTIINLANQYRWKFGFKFSDIPNNDLLPDVDFIISPVNILGANIGLEINPSFWLNGASVDLHQHCLHYLTIPASVKPEKVLETLIEVANAV